MIFTKLSALSGEVTDPAGAAVAGAKVTAIDVDRNTYSDTRAW